MVDELIMPGDEDEMEMQRMHRQWAKELQQLQGHMKAQAGKPHLWIACAGIDHGKTEHFKQTYLTSVLPPVFHLPEMDVPLRNTKQVLAMAELESNEDVKALGDVGGVAPTKTNPVYRLPDQLMAGLEGKQFLVNNRDDSDELESVVETACKEVLGRTGGAGFPVLCDTIGDLRIRSVRRGVERASATALVYHWQSTECCSEAEVEEWLRKRRRGEEERRCLIVDDLASRGWEASHLLVVALFTSGVENLVMRGVGYCALVKNL